PWIWAPPLPLPFRVLGLDATFTGPRGVALWNPPDGPVTTITLAHGALDPHLPGVRTTTRAADPAGGWSPVREAVLDALLGLPGIQDEQLRRLPATLGTGAAWEPVAVRVDARVVPAHRYRHPGGEHWVVAADLGDVGVSIAGCGRQLEEHGLLTLAGDLPGYAARPARTG
ncbi:hypothetical protein GTQ99_23120, partial [Kineococcus sp. T13]